MQKSSLCSTVEAETCFESAGLVELAVSEATETPTRDSRGTIVVAVAVAVAGAVSGEVAFAAAAPEDFVVVFAALEASGLSFAATPAMELVATVSAALEISAMAAQHVAGRASPEVRMSWET